MKVKFGAIVVAASGKIGGHVASKNKSGSYFRTKVTPGNKQSLAQLSVRGNFTANSKAWGSLTDAQRNTWNAAVENFKGSNIFGDSVTPSGFNLYMKINSNLLNVSEPVLTVAPSNISADPLTGLSATANHTTHAVTLTFSPAIGANAKMVVMATAPQPAGKSFVKNLYRQVGVYDSADVSPLVITTDYTAKFGAVSIAGQKIFFKVFVVNTDTGVSGASFPAEAVVA
jgi:hypothetical protein